MADPPDVDGRRRAAVREHLESIAPYYTEEWDPDADDPGSALLATFSDLAEEVLTRLDRVPEKQFVAFLDALGVSRTPPQPARLPLVVEVADDADGNVAISAGTRAVAESTDERPEQVFEVGSDDGFEATPANVARLYSVDPATDAVFEHGESLAEGAGSVLFDGENRQEHVLYVGDGDLLNLEAGSTVRVTMETNAPERVVRDCLVWEFYGELEVDGETKTGWHPLRGGAADPSSPCPWSEVEPVGDFVDAHEEWLKSEGYEVGDHATDVQNRLHASIAADVAGRSPRGPGADGPGGDDPPVPRNLFPPGAVDRELAGALREKIRALRDSLRAVSEAAATHRRADPGSTVAVSLEFPGPTAERTVAGRESRWIRCRLPEGELASGIFDVEFRAVGLEAGTETATGRIALTPDAMLSDDVPLPVDDRDGDLYPFGPDPQRRTTFYVASEEAFTKTGTAVALRFESPTDAADGSDETVDVSWEYWNGNGWTRLPLLEDETEGLTGAGAVRFEVPDDFEPTRVSGHEGHWIRTRLVGGDYGRARYEETSAGSWERVDSDVNPPRFSGVRLRYALTDAPDHLIPYNNLSFGDDLAEGHPARFRPFTGLSDSVQTLYVGFDEPLRGGPIPLFFPLQETEYPDEFDPRLRWEYCVDAERGDWSKLDVRDETRGLRQTGIVSLVFPEETARLELFGRELHWIRARVTEDDFASPAATLLARRLQREITTPRGVPEPHRPTVRTEPSTGEPVGTPPTLRNLHVNTGWAYNRRTVTEEVLGSSDGSREQQFTLANPPVTGEETEVWVDELAVLPEARRRELAESRPSEVEAVTGQGGDTREFWVQWEEVADFLGSGEDDRHYTLDRATGRLSFGDGVSGKIPPKGRDNVRASYRTGGGTDGNVGANAVTGFKRSLPFVDGVTNPEPAAGGTNEESMDRVRTRAPKQLRDRRRSVLVDDFERIAVDAAGELTRAKCISGMDDAGDRVPGWVTVLVVPNTQGARPVPSAELKRRVREVLRDRAPAPVVESGQRRLVVRGPTFVDVSVEATLDATAVESLSALEASVAGRVSSFLHPVSGGPEADGWEFGALPYVSDIYALLEGIEGVDHVADLSVTFEGDEDRVTVTEGDPHPRITPDTLVYSGTHDITVTGGL